MVAKITSVAQVKVWTLACLILIMLDIQCTPVEEFRNTTLITPHCFCTKEFAPVCDTNDEEYANKCVLECVASRNSSVILACSHSCPCDETTTTNTTIVDVSSTNATLWLESNSLNETDPLEI